MMSGIGSCVVFGCRPHPGRVGCPPVMRPARCVEAGNSGLELLALIRSNYRLTLAYQRCQHTLVICSRLFYT